MGAFLSVIAKHGSTIIAGAVGVLVYSVMGSIVKIGKKIFYNVICSKVRIIGADSPKSLYSIKHQLELLVDKNKLNVMTDGPTEAKFTLAYGTYRVKTPELGHVWAQYTEEGITLYTLPSVGIWPPRCQSKSIDIKKFAADTYKKHCAPSEMIMTFTSSKDKWSFPIIRRPTQFKKENLTPDMKRALLDISKFKRNSQVYLDKGVPYRRGYLLYGLTGGGKTTVVELAAKEHNMTLYNLTLNGNEMNDNVLTNLFAAVPPNSIVVLEEIDKQLKALQNNKLANVTIGGLLSAIDGPQRMSNGSLVMLTANTDDFLDKETSSYLFREGRIDRKIEFKTKIDIDMGLYDDEDEDGDGNGDGDLSEDGEENDEKIKLL